MDDADSVRAVLAGDVDAFSHLVDRYVGPLTALAYDRLGAVADAQDAVQEALTVAYGRLRDLREPGAFGGWVYGILRNEIARRQRRRQLEARAAEEITHAGPYTGALSPPEAAEAAERSRRLRRAVERLSPALREIVALRYLGGCGRQEAAALLEIDPRAADKRLERALAELRELLNEER